MGDSHVGLLARLMSQALRKLAGSIAKTNCIVIFINQLREKVGVMYGNPEVTTGGRALKFYASGAHRRAPDRGPSNGGEVIGNRTRAKIVKNKVAPPFREAEFDIMYGEGISKWGELVDLAVKLDILQKSGSWFSMGETRLGQGRDAVKQYLKDNPELADRMEAEIRANSFKLMSKQSQIAARAAGRAVDVSADDFEDGAAGRGPGASRAPPPPPGGGGGAGWRGGGAPPPPRGGGGGGAPPPYAGKELSEGGRGPYPGGTPERTAPESPQPADLQTHVPPGAGAEAPEAGRRGRRRQPPSLTGWRSWASSTTPPMPPRWSAITPRRDTGSGSCGTNCTAGDSRELWDEALEGPRTPPPPLRSFCGKVGGARSPMIHGS